MNRTKPGHGNVFRRHLPSLERYCYGITYHEVLLLLFDFLTPTPTIDPSFFCPANIGGLLWVGDLEEGFEKCHTIDLSGQELAKWEAVIPVSHFIKPDHFRRGPNDEELFKTYNFGKRPGFPEYVTREEIADLGIVPRLFLGDISYTGDEDTTLLLEAVHGFRSLAEPPGSPETAPPDNSSKGDLEPDVITVRFGIDADRLDPKLATGSEGLADLCDEVEEALFDAGGEEYEPATVGQELSGELFWIVEIFAASPEAAQPVIQSISTLIQTRFGGVNPQVGIIHP